MTQELIAARRALLQEISDLLGALHKLLIGEARADYEKEQGAIPSSTAFLRLLMEDPYFRWLRELSGAMADLDELIDEEEELSREQAIEMARRFEALVTQSDDSGEFGPRYRRYLQSSPDVVMAHAAVRMALGPLHQ